MFNKKSQAAMEFLMTYGWAILIVLAVIATLTAFGVLNTDIFIPSRCTIGEVGVINCFDYSIMKDADGTMKVFFNLENGGGKGDLKVKSVTLTGGDLSDAKCGGEVNAAYTDQGTGFGGKEVVDSINYMPLAHHEKEAFYLGDYATATAGTELLFSGGDCSALTTISTGRKVRVDIKLVYFTGSAPTTTHTLEGQLVVPVEEG